MTAPAFVPLTISWNLTRRCNLACAHCYIDASARPEGGELTPAEAAEVLQQLAAVNPQAVLILTGGEPLLRPDIYDLVARAASLGFWTVLGSHGGLLDGAAAGRLQEAGLKGVGVSLDSVDPAKHDRFRGIERSWSRTVSALGVMKERGLPFLIETTVTRMNRGELSAMAGFAAERGAAALNVFFLVPTGRGADLSDLSPREYEDCLGELARLQRAHQGRLFINAKCAPHYRRVLWELDHDSEFVRTFHGGGCPAGTYYCRVTPQGGVTPCPYMPLTVGSMRERSFAEIWNGSPVLKEFREAKRGGRCGACEFGELCGGCRCRAYALTGDYLAEDPSCAYEPGRHIAAAIPLSPERTYGAPEAGGLAWSPEARRRLEAVPFFARGMVARAVEKAAAERGERVVTESLMIELRRKMASRFPLPASAQPGVDPPAEGAGPAGQPRAADASSSPPDAAGPGAAQPGAAATARPARILLVEDAPQVAGILVSKLGREGHQVAWTRSRIQALDALRREAFDLILLSTYLLPERDSWRALAEIAALPGAPPILMILEAEESPLQPQALAGGARGVILKPFKPTVVARQIAGVLRSPASR